MLYAVILHLVSWLSRTLGTLQPIAKPGMWIPPSELSISVPSIFQSFPEDRVPRDTLDFRRISLKFFSNLICFPFKTMQTTHHSNLFFSMLVLKFCDFPTCWHLTDFPFPYCLYHALLHYFILHSGWSLPLHRPHNLEHLQSLLWLCINYLSAVVIKHQDQGNLS